MWRMHPTWRSIALFVMAATLLVPSASARPAEEPLAVPVPVDKSTPEPSGIYDFRDLDFGTGITECPQAGVDGTEPRPLDLRPHDAVEQLSNRGNDRRVNQDFSCFPQNEVSVDTNPRDARNVVVGMNDYRLGTGSSGFAATTNGGRSWYDGIIPFPTGPAALTRGEGLLPSGGDPAIAYDREGVVYYAQIAFFRGTDVNGVFVSRSTNGGFTWSRACIPVDLTPADPTDDVAACGAIGDARQPGDGRVSFNPDNDALPNGSVPFDDKEYLTAGPRPAGVQPVCYTPLTRVPTACNPAVVGVDRLYVTFSRFDSLGSRIFLSTSDDQGRSWSPPVAVSGSAAFCIGSPGNGCNFNQYSVPTVSPATGYLYVQFNNGNTPDENQFLVVRSQDGGATMQGPFFVTPVYELNFPRAGVTRPDCTARGQQAGRIVYTNSCFRSNPAGNIVVDKRGGAYADDLYLVMSDNRNGTLGSSNADIFLFKSTDGGSTWIGPTRVNNDRSDLGGVSRDCGRPPGTIGSLPIPPACVGDFGADQWWPWVDIGSGGELNIVMKDRRLDPSSTAHEWPDSRQRPGNYLVWTWGVQCRVREANSRECLAPGASVIPQPTGPVDPGPDPVPGQGAAYLGTLRNFKISDVPSNYDYSFRAGIFAGDYENVAVFDARGGGNAADEQAASGSNQGSGAAMAVFTDARNGRSSRNQPGRNPICEQADAFFDTYSATNGGSGGAAGTIGPFLVTPCPAQAVEPQDDDQRGRGTDG